MAYSESLAERIRHLWGRRRDITEKKMFGGVGFMLHGNLCVGVWKTSLIARLGPDQSRAALQEPHVREFDVTGRPMQGWVLVDAEGIDADHELATWIDRCEQFVQTLPKKK